MSDFYLGDVVSPSVELSANLPAQHLELDSAATKSWVYVCHELAEKEPWLFVCGIKHTKAKVLELASCLAARDDLEVVESKQLEEAVKYWRLFFGPNGQRSRGIVYDENLHLVFWRGRQCPIRQPNSRRLMAVLAKAYQYRSFVHCDAITNALDDPQASRDSVRKAISRLRDELRKGGVGELADAIRPAKWETPGSYAIQFEDGYKR